MCKYGANIFNNFVIAWNKRKQPNSTGNTKGKTVNDQVSAAEHRPTQLHQAFCLAAKQSRHKPHRLCCVGVLWSKQDVYGTEFRSWVWRISKTECIPWL